MSDDSTVSNPHDFRHDAEGVEFLVDVALPNGLHRCRCRCDAFFGYTSWYAEVTHVEHTESLRSLLRDLPAAVLTAIENFALVALEQKRNEDLRTAT